VHIYTALVERDPETGYYVGHVPGLAGAHTQGATLDELGANLREVIGMLLEDGDMSRTPPEDLVVIARKLDPDFHAQVVGPWDDTQTWRALIPASLRKIWGKLDYSERLVAFVLTNDDTP